MTELNRKSVQANCWTRVDVTFAQIVLGSYERQKPTRVIETIEATASIGNGKENQKVNKKK